MFDSLRRYLGTPMRTLAVAVTISSCICDLRRYFASPMRGLAVEDASREWGDFQVLVYCGDFGSMQVGPQTETQRVF